VEGMSSADAESGRSGPSDGKDAVIASVAALAAARGIRVLRGGGTVFAKHGLISPRVAPFTAFIVDPKAVNSLTRALTGNGWRVLRDSLDPRLLPSAIVRLARADFDGILQLHGVLPGFFADPAAVFDFMWHGRARMTIAGVEVPVLDRLCTVMLAAHDRLEGRGYRRGVEGENFSYFVSQFRAALSADERDTLAWMIGLFGADDELRPLLDGLALPIGARASPSTEYVRARLELEFVTAGDIWIVEHLERPRRRRDHHVPVTQIAPAVVRLLGARRRAARAARAARDDEA
jgi:hypothetical protein